MKSRYFFFTLKLTVTAEFRLPILAMRIGSISSLVAKNTASMVPRLTEPVEKSVAAAPEMPHWGITPSMPPMAGPAFLE